MNMTAAIQLVQDNTANFVSLTRRDSDVVYCTLNHPGSPTMTMEVLNALNLSLHEVSHKKSSPCQYFVLQSARHDVFSLGGDLEYFVNAASTGNRKALEEYMALCLEMIEANASGLYVNAHTIAAVRGKAFGGGFEAALSCNTIIAEEDAEFGFPETLFNMFPGMGAHLRLEQRVGTGLAERIMRSAKIYTAKELYDIGVVDRLAKSGNLDEAVRQHINIASQRDLSNKYFDRIRRILSPLDRGRLAEIGELWIDCALNLRERDLNLMSRIAKAQHRSYGD